MSGMARDVVEREVRGRTPEAWGVSMTLLGWGRRPGKPYQRAAVVVCRLCRGHGERAAAWGAGRGLG